MVLGEGLVPVTERPRWEIGDGDCVDDHFGIINVWSNWAVGVVFLFDLGSVLYYQRKKKSVQSNESSASCPWDKMHQTGPKKTQPR